MMILTITNLNKDTIYGFFILKIVQEEFLSILDKEFIIQTDPSYLSSL